MSKNCTVCSNAIFCESWGEYKCKERKERISDTDEGACCGLYSKGTPSTDCHCETCEERGAIEDDC